MLRQSLIVLVLALGCRERRAEPDAIPTSAAAPKGLVGIWRVVRFCDDDSTGKLTEPMGPNPSGYFIYAPTGQLSIQAMGSPAPKPFRSGDDFRPSGEEAQALLSHQYFGYYGTYTVVSDSVVVHHVEGGTLPSYIGTDQSRVYRLRGDTLTIGGTPATWPCRLLIRER